jgi:hypothetical protein
VGARSQRASMLGKSVRAENQDGSRDEMEVVRTSETSVDNHFTRQYNPEDSSEH